MAKEGKFVGIDIGTKYIYAMIGLQREGDAIPSVVGVGKSEVDGVRNGNIISKEDVIDALQKAINEAKNYSGLDISSAVVGIGGKDSVSAITSNGVVAVQRADKEVSNDDITRVIGDAEKNAIIPVNRTVIHTIPLEFMVDDEINLKDVVGMHGVRLEAKILFICVSSMQLNILESCINACGVKVEEFVLSSLAASDIVLSKKNQELGVVCIDIGGGTTDVAVFEERDLIHASVIPIGGNNITNDLAIGLKVNHESAERVKLNYGSALYNQPKTLNKRNVVDLRDKKKQDQENFSKVVVDIINPRVSEIFDLVNKDLKSIGKNSLLPGGAILVGGTAKIPFIDEVCKEVMGLPTKVGLPDGINSSVGSVSDPTFASALGLMMWGYKNHSIDRSNNSNMPKLTSSIPHIDNLSNKAGLIKSFFKAFLP